MAVVLSFEWIWYLVVKCFGPCLTEVFNLKCIIEAFLPKSCKFTRWTMDFWSSQHVKFRNRKPCFRAREVKWEKVIPGSTFAEQYVIMLCHWGGRNVYFFYHRSFYQLKMPFLQLSLSSVLINLHFLCHVWHMLAFAWLSLAFKQMFSCHLRLMLLNVSVPEIRESPMGFHCHHDWQSSQSHCVDSCLAEHFTLSAFSSPYFDSFASFSFLLIQFL